MFLFMPLFSGALMFACQKRSDGFRCSPWVGVWQEAHSLSWEPWIVSEASKPGPAVLTAAAVFLGSLRKENCLK